VSHVSTDNNITLNFIIDASNVHKKFRSFTIGAYNIQYLNKN